MPRWPVESDWAAIRPVFSQLYLDENKTLKHVRELLKVRHGFEATCVYTRLHD